MFKGDLALNNLQLFIWHKTKPNQTKPNHLYLIYMFEVDLALNNLLYLICHKNKLNQIIMFIYMCKEHLALNNLRWLICHKTQPKIRRVRGHIEVMVSEDLLQNLLVSRTEVSPSGVLYSENLDTFSWGRSYLLGEITEHILSPADLLAIITLVGWRLLTCMDSRWFSLQFNPEMSFFTACPVNLSCLKFIVSKFIACKLFVNNFRI